MLINESIFMLSSNQQVSRVIPTFTDILPFIRSLEQNFKNWQLASLDEFNLSKLSSICRRLDQILNDDFIPAADLQKILLANTLRNKRSNSISFPELRLMKDGAVLVLRREKYKAIINDLNADEANSFFNVAAKKAESLDRKQEFISIQKSWRKRSKLSCYSSATIQEFLLPIEQLEQYLAMLARDFQYSSTRIFWINMSGITQEKSNEIIAFIDGVNIKIHTLRTIIADAMLQRLLLLPRDTFLSRDNKPATYQDDLVFATLSSLVNLGIIRQNYLTNFNDQCPPFYSLTSDITTQFKEFIIKYGANATKLEYENHYKKTYEEKFEPYQLPKMDLLQSQIGEDYLLIPLCIKGHYHLRAAANTEFIYIESEQQGKEDLGIISGMVISSQDSKSAKNSLEFTIWDTASNERIVIPIVDEYARINIYDPKIRALYGLIFEDNYLLDESAKDFSHYMLDETQESALKELAVKHFSKQLHRDLFIQTAKDIASNSKEKDIETITLQALTYTLDQIIKSKRKEIIESLHSNSLISLEECLRILEFLKIDYLNCKKLNFETFIDADNIYIKLQVALTLLNHHDIKTTVRVFIDLALSYFRKLDYANAHDAIEEASLEVFVNLPTIHLTTQQRLNLKLDIKAIPQWQDKIYAWFDLYNLYMLKSTVLKDLQNELTRLSENIGKFYISTSVTQNKISIILKTMQDIDAASNKDEVKRIIDNLSTSSIYISTNIFKISGIFSSVSSQKLSDIKTKTFGRNS